MTSPTDNPIVISAMEGCKHMLAKPVMPKDPLPVDVFARLVQALAVPKHELIIFVFSFFACRSCRFYARE